MQVRVDGLQHHTYVKKVVGNMKSVQYKDLLSDYAVPTIKQKFVQNFEFQQYNCSVHTSALMKKFFEKEHIQTLDWPTRSPDLNPLNPNLSACTPFVNFERNTDENP